MKIILNETQEFEVVTPPTLSGDPINFFLSDTSNLPESITGNVILQDEIVWPKTGVVKEGEDPLCIVYQLRREVK